MIGIYLILSYSLNLLVGFGGLLSLCHAIFYGIGAYTTALLLTTTGISFIYAISISFIVTGMFALLIGIPALKFRGDSFVLVTLGFQMIGFIVLYNWVSFTRGPFGISNIPNPMIAGFRFISLFDFLLLVSVCVILIIAFLFIIYKSPFVLAIKALRDNEMAAEGLGISPFYCFLFAFVISGMIASVAGSLYATYINYIDPTSFTLDESIFLLSILLVGGSANRTGPFIGVVFMILLPELLRYLGLPNSIAPNIRQIIYGGILIVLMFLRPQGIAGEYKVK